MTIKLPPLPSTDHEIKVRSAAGQEWAYRVFSSQQMEAYAREAVRLNMAPLSDEQAKKLCSIGPVYAPNGLVERTGQEYRRELEAAMLHGLRNGEAAHGIKGD